jgi:hypothetical protein
LNGRGQLMPVGMAAHIAQQVARGLHYAHQLTDEDGVALGVIHRDVSPTNVMLLRTGEVKILDFGVAKAERVLKQGATVAGKVKGKLSYMAPEQHSGKQVDQRADVFAAGVMLWEMLTGELLFSGAKGGERSRKMMRNDVPAPSAFRSKLPPELDAIVMRCLKLRPDDRYPTAGALADDLGAYVRSTMFDPGDLVTLVKDYAVEAPLEAGRAPAANAPMVIDSHAILTREDDHADSDLDLMSAATARERVRPILLPAAGAATVGEAALAGEVVPDLSAKAVVEAAVEVAVDVDSTAVGETTAVVVEARADGEATAKARVGQVPPVGAQPLDGAASPREEPPLAEAVSTARAWTVRRWWPAGVALAAAVGLAVTMAPRRPAPLVPGEAAVRPHTEIEPVVSPPAVADEAPPPEPRALPPPEAPPPRPPRPAPVRRRAHPPEPRPDSPRADPELKLIDPF